jgi:hypothetical protein
MNLLPVSLMVLVAATNAGIPTEEEMTEASAPYERCLDVQAARLDDGLSDIDTTGKAVADACDPEFQEMTKILLNKTFREEDKKNLQASFEWMRAGTGAKAVGKLRYEKRNAPPK